MKTKSTVWIGRILSPLAILFLAFDGITKFFMDKLPPEALKAAESLQWPLEQMPLAEGILLFCTLLYSIPRTAVVGAILLTGYLGGATALQLRVGNPYWSHVFVPLYLGAIAWLGLFLRDQRVENIWSKKVHSTH